MPQKQTWNDLVREVCQALARRDAIDCRSEADPDATEACRQRRFWQAQAESRLSQLSELVERVPQPAMARETLAELAEWVHKEAVVEEA